MPQSNAAKKPPFGRRILNVRAGPLASAQAIDAVCAQAQMLAQELANQPFETLALVQGQAAAAPEPACPGEAAEAAKAADGQTGLAQSPGRDEAAECAPAAQPAAIPSSDLLRCATLIEPVVAPSFRRPAAPKPLRPAPLRAPDQASPAPLAVRKRDPKEIAALARANALRELAEEAAAGASPLPEAPSPVAAAPARSAQPQRAPLQSKAPAQSLSQPGRDGGPLGASRVRKLTAQEVSAKAQALRTPQERPGDLPEPAKEHAAAPSPAPAAHGAAELAQPLPAGARPAAQAPSQTAPAARQHKPAAHPQRTQAQAKRPAPAGRLRDLRNAFMGMALAYMECVTDVFEPVFFTVKNMHMIAAALLHVLVPLSASWFISHWTESIELAFWSGSAGGQFMNYAGLVAFCSFVWSLFWMVAKTLVLSAKDAIKGFEETGSKFFDKNA